MDGYGATLVAISTSTYQFLCNTDCLPPRELKYIMSSIVNKLSPQLIHKPSRCSVEGEVMDIGTDQVFVNREDNLTFFPEDNTFPGYGHSPPKTRNIKSILKRPGYHSNIPSDFYPGLIQVLLGIQREKKKLKRIQRYATISGSATAQRLHDVLTQEDVIKAQ
ncbi:hypothetical protein CAPTEDRAFT_209519 [Capitella teleta]|uniref:Uncharacterized protein n=1 Tax=Capitella teleta TaxID=283909 RepID=R7TFU3_CAPTE|nr:hypothetical protein CAPTEDRAFT_209519 [Capitella teleta]|eukprot:ELT92663.1 hypothetical protein CAPTEDRAFT_209519 [Capitella teleta]